MRRAGGFLSVLALICAIGVLAGCASTPGVDKQAAADANASMGADFLKKNQNDQALTYYRKALNYDDDNFSANWGMAIVQSRLDRPDQARRYYEKTLDLQPSAEIYNSYGVFLCRQGDTDKAVGYFKKAANDPRYAGKADALANAGLCLYRAHRYDAARTDLRDALDANASQATALVTMAKIEHAEHNDLHARAFIERADAVTTLAPDALLLAARIELAMGDSAAAESYLKRHNASKPTAALSLSQLEQSPQ